MDKKYNVIIIDDDSVSLTCLEGELSFHKDMTVVAKAKDNNMGRKKILKYRPDLLFLDVELPDGFGYNLLETIRDQIKWKMKVIFYTAHDDYMLQAIRNSAFDYLMKPFDSNELNLMLNRFREDFVKSKMEIPILLSGVSNSFLIATPLGYRKVHFNEIGYFEYNKDKRSWQAMLVDKSSLTLKVNTKAESILNVSETFFKISKQHIINLSYLSIIDDGRCFLLDPFNDTRLSISRDSLKNLHNKYGDI